MGTWLDPEGVGDRNQLNLVNALNLPNDDLLDKIAHGDGAVMADLLGKLDSARKEKILNELQKLDSSGTFMWEDQKALLKYMKQVQ